MDTILLMDSARILEWGGFIILLILIYAETGLLLGLIIPGGETLLFTAGLLTGTETLNAPLLLLLLGLIIVGFLGDLTGYWIGKKYGKQLYEKEDRWYFKKKYLKMTEDFYQNHKKTALLIGKFLPVIRPFNPVIAGTTGINFSVFLSISLLACILYMSFFILLGYFLGNKFPVIKDYLGWIIPISICIALIPVIIQIRKMRRK